MAIETFKHAGNTVHIEQDDDCESPYSAWDQGSVLACWHRHMNLGSEQLHPEHFDSMDDLIASLESEGALFIRPVYAYEHSGITISLGAFGDPWDSGQVGVIYTTRKLWDARVGGELNAETAEALYRDEIASYDQYLRGECYGYTVESPEGDLLDSCWGFLGDISYCITEAKSAAESYANA
jgi:hypothetical protein